MFNDIILYENDNNMKNITTTTKTILFASIIAAMILPFSVMGMADAAPNENANETAKEYVRAEIPEGYDMTPFGIWKKTDIKEWDGVTPIDTDKDVKDWKDAHPGEKTPADIAVEKMQKKSEGHLPGFTDGWNKYGHISYATEPSSFTAYWKVPNAPVSYSSGDVIFYFNAFQGTGTNVIVQPVLQYGNSAACNSASWKIASWILSGPFVYKTSCASASTGNTIKGEILSQGNTWTVKTTNVNTSTTKTLSASSSYDMIRANVALETHGLPPTCAYVPNDVQFYSMKINGATPPSWTEYSGYTWCGMDLVSSSGSTVNINTDN